MSDTSESVTLCASSNGALSESFSVERLLTSRQNSWRDWYCSAGTENLHITPDGNVLTATCGVGGILGNVFDTASKKSLNLPQSWIQCTKQWCMCGSDMQLRKARSLAFRARTYEPTPENRGRVDRADWVVPAQFEAHTRFPKSITWDLSRRCNYSCSYCHPDVSNHTDPHRSQDELFAAVDEIEKQFCKGISTKWVFTGGEPTLNPAFVDLVDRINSRGHLVHVQSNGSRGPDYFSTLAQKACVGLSLHIESVRESALERFLSTVCAMLDARSSFWLGVRIMVPPGTIEEALKIRERLIDESQKRNGVLHVHLSPLYERLKQDQLQRYEPDELRVIQNLS